MATTLVPLPGKLARTATRKQIQKTVHQWLTVDQANLDKASEMMDAEYYQGAVDALRDVLFYMEEGPRVWDDSTRLFNSKLFALVPAAVAVTYVITNHRKDPNADA